MDTELTVVVVLVLLAALAGAALLVVHGRRYRQEQERMAAALLRKPDDDMQLGADRPGGGWHGPSCSGGFPAVDPASREPVVPAQRSGDHDRHEPVRARPGRLLRRRG